MLSLLYCCGVGFIINMPLSKLVHMYLGAKIRRLKLLNLLNISDFPKAEPAGHSQPLESQSSMSSSMQLAPLMFFCASLDVCGRAETLCVQ